jgi:hypothetical protein
MMLTGFDILLPASGAVISIDSGWVISGGAVVAVAVGTSGVGGAGVSVGMMMTTVAFPDDWSSREDAVPLEQALNIKIAIVGIMRNRFIVPPKKFCNDYSIRIFFY